MSSVSGVSIASTIGRDHRPEHGSIDDDTRTAGYTYDAFISYRRTQGWRVASWLSHKLERYRPPEELLKQLPAALSERLRQPRQVFLDKRYAPRPPEVLEIDGSLDEDDDPEIKKPPEIVPEKPPPPAPWDRPDPGWQQEPWAPLSGYLMAELRRTHLH